MSSTIFVRRNIAAAVFLAAGAAAAQGAGDATGALTVVVDGARSAEGVIRIAVCADEDCYQNNGPFVAKANKPASENAVKFEISDLPIGRYAVVLHHDEDADGTFDKFLFAPLEGYGFSNNAKPKLGRPPFYVVAFDLTEAGAVAPITVQY